MKFLQAKYYRKGPRKDITMLVIHDMEYPERGTSAEWCAGFFQNPLGVGGKPVVASAHYCVDDDSVMQCVRDEDTAWHAGPVNDVSIGIEHAGYAGQTAAQWRDEYSTAMLLRSAELAAQLCVRWGIPPVRLTAQDLARGMRRGICGHADVTNGLQNGKGHWDPGPNFPWDWYLGEVARRTFELRGLPPPPPPPPAPPPVIIDPTSSPDFSSFAEVELDGVIWEVAPIYVAPVAIGQARDLVARLGCELPTPALVDAIWKAADMKIDAAKMVYAGHDGTPRTMNSPETHARQAEKLRELVGDRSFGVDWKLLAGAFKDVVIHNGKIGLYGWHRIDGRVIQPFFGGHALAWGDYSQGVRAVRKKKA